MRRRARISPRSKGGGDEDDVGKRKKKKSVPKNGKKCQKSIMSAWGLRGLLRVLKGNTLIYYRVPCSEKFGDALSMCIRTGKWQGDCANSTHTINLTLSQRKGDMYWEEKSERFLACLLRQPNGLLFPA